MELQTLTGERYLVDSAETCLEFLSNYTEKDLANRSMAGLYKSYLGENDWETSLKLTLEYYAKLAGKASRSRE